MSDTCDNNPNKQTATSEQKPGMLRKWWPILLPFAVLIAISIAGMLIKHNALGNATHDEIKGTKLMAKWQKDTIQFREIPEIISIPLMACVTAAYASRLRWKPDALAMLLTLLGAAFLCREIHFTGTHRGVYVAVGLLLAWGIAWRKRLKPPLADKRHMAWVYAAACAYVLSQLVSKRVFRRIPTFRNSEEFIHIMLEEGMELTAHTIFLLSAFAGNRSPGGHSQGQAGADSNEKYSTKAPCEPCPND